MRTMYDSTNVANLPAGAPLYAGYVDGAYANFSQLQQRFPNATLVPIAVFASTNAGIVLDVETGDATPAQAPGWCTMRRSAGVIPTVYTYESNWQNVRNAFYAAGVNEPNYWIAAYPGTVGAGSLYPDSVAHQYEDYQNLYDISCVADYWSGVDPDPQPPSPLPFPFVLGGEELIASTVTGNGYVCAQANGGVFAYGDANYHGGANQGQLSAGDSIVGISLRVQNDGYWLYAMSGAVFAFGNAAYLGGPNAQ